MPESRTISVVFFRDACFEHRGEYFNHSSNNISRYYIWKCDKCLVKTWIVEEPKY